MELTQKQIGFANDVFADISFTQAYRNHYSTSNMLPATIERNAFALRYSSKVSARLAELNSKVDNKLIASKEERKQILSEIARDKKQNSVHAIDVHNKMDKIYTEALPTGDIVQNFVFVLPDGTRVLPAELQRHKELGEGKNGQEGSS